MRFIFTSLLMLFFIIVVKAQYPELLGKKPFYSPNIGELKVFKLNDGTTFLHGSFSFINEKITWNPGSQNETWSNFVMIRPDGNIKKLSNIFRYFSCSGDRMYCKLSSGSKISAIRSDGSTEAVLLKSVYADPYEVGDLWIVNDYIYVLHYRWEGSVGEHVLVRYKKDYTIDQSFKPLHGGLISQLYGYQDKIIVLGTFDNFNGHPTKKLAVINNDGIVNTDFKIDDSSLNPFYGSNVVDLKDGRFLVCGDFTMTLNGNSYRNVIVIKPDGVVDNGMLALAIKNKFSRINSIQLFDDNSLLISGEINSTIRELITWKCDLMGKSDATFKSLSIPLPSMRSSGYSYSSITTNKSGFELYCSAFKQIGQRSYNVLSFDKNGELNASGHQSISNYYRIINASKFNNEVLVLKPKHTHSDKYIEGVKDKNELTAQVYSFIEANFLINGEVRKIVQASDGFYLLGDFIEKSSMRYTYFIKVKEDMSIDERFKNIMASDLLNIIPMPDGGIYIIERKFFDGGKIIKIYVQQFDKNLNRIKTFYLNDYVPESIYSVEIEFLKDKMVVVARLNRNNDHELLVYDNHNLDQTPKIRKKIDNNCILKKRDEESFALLNLSNSYLVANISFYDLNGTLIDNSSIIGESFDRNWSGIGTGFLSFLQKDSYTFVGGAFNHCNFSKSHNFACLDKNNVPVENLCFSTNGPVKNIFDFDKDHIIITGDFTQFGDLQCTGAIMLRISNFVPQITSQNKISMFRKSSKDLSLDMITIYDPDNKQGKHTLSILPGESYSFSGTRITLNDNVTGQTWVNIAVSDGKDTCDTYKFQIDVLNDIPKIKEQKEITLLKQEKKRITTDLLIIEDADDETSIHKLKAFAGDNYRVEGDDIIIPNAGYKGQLIVPVMVSDGIDQSAKFDLIISVVNYVPTITGQGSIATKRIVPVNLIPSMFTIEDKDDNLSAMSLEILPGEQYTFSGTLLIPDKKLCGEIKVKVVVSDGDGKSNPFEAIVKLINTIPVINAQNEISMNRWEPKQFTASEFVISDDDDEPGSHTIKVQNGNHYTSDGKSVTVNPDYTNDLSVNVVACDAYNESAPFVVKIKLVNDIPRIKRQQEIILARSESRRLNVAMLDVEDKDDTHTKLTMIIGNGANYSISDKTIITPTDGFTGTLKVPVRVSDGIDVSEEYILNVYVMNFIPKLIAQKELQTKRKEAITITKDDVSIEDRDNLTKDIILKVVAGNGYTYSGNTVTATTGFWGAQNINVTLNDGIDESPVYQVLVTFANSVPLISAQKEITVGGLKTIELTKDMFSITDEDNEWADLSIRVLEGSNYSFEGNKITPIPGFLGEFEINVVAFDGMQQSEVYKAKAKAVQLVSVKWEELGNTSLYPNPVFDKYCLTLSNDVVGTGEVEIFSENGQLIRKIEISKKDYFYQYSDNVSSLSPGVYFLVIRIKDKYQRFKMMKK